MTPPTLSGPVLRVVGPRADPGLSRAGDLRGAISPARQMKCGAGGTRFRSVDRLPRGERLDRVVAAFFVVLAQVELWVGHVIPGPKALAVAYALVLPGSMILLRGAVRGRELRAEALAARAELLEREREMLAQTAVADERARIARELHALVAHNVSVMVVQAGAERHALGDERPQTREALASLEQAGRQAMAEARRLLGMLRRDGVAETLEPQPGIDHLDVLVEQVERAGLPVALDIDGERVPLPAGLDLCAYRIVQDGLTNALKHAGPAHARVRVHFAPGALDVEVADDGRGMSNGGGDGHGLIGMRERVALYGGSLQTGARDGGGFAIHARLPIG